MSEKKHLTSQVTGPSIQFRLLVPASILALTIIGVVIMVLTKPKPTTKPRGERAAIVDTAQLTVSTERVVIEANGTITPSREITLQPQVSGRIIWIDPRFEPGGSFSDKETILKIDPTDYETALTASEAAAAKAEADFKAEQGLQDIARLEWESLQSMDGDKKFSELDKELSLRKPNLLTAESNLKAAQAQLAQAKVNLARTEVTAPFNCVVRSRNVNTGSQVSPQTQLAELSGTDSMWVMTTIPVSSMKWIRAADGSGSKGSAVIISAVPGIDLNAKWEGHVLRIMPDLEKNGKQAQLIVEIPEPGKPSKGSGKLLLGSYVRLTIEGAKVADVFKIPSSTLHGGNSVWILSTENRLDVRPVETVWTGREAAFLSKGVEPGELIVTSDLGTPVTGMLLKNAGAEKDKGQEEPK